MSGIHQYRVLAGAFGKDHLMERGKAQGIGWNEDNHEGVNWMRFSRALHQHLEHGGDFDVEGTDPKVLRAMLQHLETARELHKQTMIPHVRAAMVKLQSTDTTTNKHYMEYLKQAYKHLDANGGHVWAEKVQHLNGLNRQISGIKDKLAKV